MFYDFRGQDCTYNVRSTGSYIVFEQVVPIYNCKHVPGLVAQYNAESKKNVTCTEVMDLTHSMILNNNLSNKDPYVVPEQEYIIILYIK